VAAVELRDVNVLLGEHRRWRWWRWRFCRCGLTHPCRLRRLALAEAWRMYAELAEAQRRQTDRLADGDTVNVAGFKRYADLLVPAPVPPGVGRSPVVGDEWPSWSAGGRR
jgi:hypothetical protein